jgi:hypothetical protein
MDARLSKDRAASCKEQSAVQARCRVKRLGRKKIFEGEVISRSCNRKKTGFFKGFF